MSSIVISAPSAFLIQGVARGGARIFSKGVPPPPPPSRLSDLYQKWFTIPSLARFSVSGNIGTLCFYFIERFIYNWLCQQPSLPAFAQEFKDSISYFLGYLLQIVSQHLLNALLVYGLDTINTKKKYYSTLLAQFAVYGFSLVGSTILNYALLQTGMDRTKAFFATMILFAFVNYALINWSVQKSAILKTDKRKTTNIPRGGRIYFNPGRPVNAERVNQTRLAFVTNKQHKLL